PDRVTTGHHDNATDRAGATVGDDEIAVRADDALEGFGNRNVGQLCRYDGLSDRAEPLDLCSDATGNLLDRRFERGVHEPDRYVALCDLHGRREFRRGRVRRAIDQQRNDDEDERSNGSHGVLLRTLTTSHQRSDLAAIGRSDPAPMSLKA